MLDAVTLIKDGFVHGQCRVTFFECIEGPCVNIQFGKLTHDKKFKKNSTPQARVLYAMLWIIMQLEGDLLFAKKWDAEFREANNYPGVDY